MRRTRALVCSPMSGASFSAFDTVVTPRPAASAMVRSVADGRREGAASSRPSLPFSSSMARLLVLASGQAAGTHQAVRGPEWM